MSHLAGVRKYLSEKASVSDIDLHVLRVQSRISYICEGGVSDYVTDVVLTNSSNRNHVYLNYLKSFQ